MSDARAYDPFDATLEEAREEQTKAQRLRAEQEASEFRNLMKTPQFRRFMWGMLERTEVYQSSYRGDNATEFREGQRAIGLVYLKRIHDLCPEQYITMLQERRAEEEQQDGR